MYRKCFHTRNVVLCGNLGGKRAGEDHFVSDSPFLHTFFCAKEWRWLLLPDSSSRRLGAQRWIRSSACTSAGPDEVRKSYTSPFAHRAHFWLIIWLSWYLRAGSMGLWDKRMIMIQGKALYLHSNLLSWTPATNLKAGMHL